MRGSLWLSIVFLLAATSTPLAQSAAKLDGVWTAVAAERDGKSAADVVGHKLVFSGDKFTITRDGNTLFAGTYSTDLAKGPAEIDLVNTQGNLKGTWMGIFRLDGETLNICDNAPDMTKPRPNGFAAPEGSGYVFIVFARDKS
jgi:uncharacterized protein (TIGR03067 family)